jgi:DNA polymerase-3 subunit beta
MKFSVNKTDIRNVLGRLQGLTGRRTNFAITETVLLDAADGTLRMTATDLETGFEGSYPAVVEEPGVIAVNGRKLHEIVKDFPSELIRVEEVENRWIEIGDQRVEYHLVGLDPEEFPDMPVVADARFASLPADALRRMIERTIVITPPPEDNRAHVTGVYLELLNAPDKAADESEAEEAPAAETDDEAAFSDPEYPEPEADFQEADEGESSAEAPTEEGSGRILRMVATDSSRLATADHPLAAGGDPGLDGGVIIPKKGLQEVAKFLEGDAAVQVAVQSSHFIVKKAAETMTVRLLEGDFPRYAEIMNQTDGVDIRMNRQLFLMTLRRMSILSTEKYKGVIFDFSQDRLLVSATNPDMGESKEEVAVAYDGEPVEMAFNPKFFIDALGVIEDDHVIVHITNASRPCRIRGEFDTRFVSVIMPMKL